MADHFTWQRPTGRSTRPECLANARRLEREAADSWRKAKRGGPLADHFATHARQCESDARWWRDCAVDAPR